MSPFFLCSGKAGYRSGRTKALDTLIRLEAAYPEAKCALLHADPFQLLIATILSAQCTDVRVNQVTPLLFRCYPDAARLAAASKPEIEEIIHSTGFFRSKAKNLIACAKSLVDRHNGEVPDELLKLIALSGVGRKTANVLLGNAFDIPGMVVDTHVKRIVYRLGWTEQRDPVKVEKALSRLLPEEKWTKASHTLIFHGRAVCKAPTPECSLCCVVKSCPQNGVKRWR
ncbi:MAG: endonuclease III [Desulfuromonadales bacterium]|nr:endonuclease III [Desulfuromonadales bacterium]